LQAEKHTKTYPWVLKMWFWYDTINKLQNQKPYMNRWMDLLGDLLTTHPIQTHWEFTIKPYTSWWFGWIDNPDCQFGNGSVWTWTWTRSHDPEPLLTLGIHVLTLWNSIVTTQRILSKVRAMLYFRETSISFFEFVDTIYLINLIKEISFLLL
jgi:hypothetical protein